MAQSSGREVIEVDSSVDVLEQVGTDAVYIGTEALLHRVSSADHVVFLDFDSEVLAPRAGAGRDALALLVRASRIVGTSGSILIQTRHRDHDLVHALSLVHNDVEALRRWEERDSEMRKMLSLPPYSAVARVRLDSSIEPSEVFSDQRVSWARETEHVFMVRAADRNVLHESLLAVRATHGGLVRVDLDPIRY
jgi:primosomal protein N'